MIRRYPTEEQFQWVKEAAKNFGVNRGYFDGSPEDRFIGKMAEKQVGDLFKVEVKPYGEFDDGQDVFINGKWWDVKDVRGEGLYRLKWNHNVSANQINYNNYGYIFVHYQNTNGVYTIVGFMEKQEFLKKAMFAKQGEMIKHEGAGSLIVPVDTYYIKGRDVHKIELLCPESDENKPC
jgi:hypothetical protein